MSYGAHAVDYMLGRLTLSLGAVEEAGRHHRSGLEWREREGGLTADGVSVPQDR